VEAVHIKEMIETLVVAHLAQQEEGEVQCLVATIEVPPLTLKVEEDQAQEEEVVDIKEDLLGSVLRATLALGTGALNLVEERMEVLDLEEEVEYNGAEEVVGTIQEVEGNLEGVDRIALVKKVNNQLIGKRSECLRGGKAFKFLFQNDFAYNLKHW